MKDFMVLVNYKTYVESMGKRGLQLTKELESAAREYPDITTAVAPCAPDIRMIASETSLKVYAQHVDPVGFGSYTGSIHPACAKEAGASGVIINHSEDRRTLADINAVLSMCRDICLGTVVCTDTVESTRAAAALKPDYVAIEPPELIGGDISVSTAKPELIADSVTHVSGIDVGVRVLCGAGVKNGLDVKKSIELGSRGILLASGITKSKEPRRAMTDILSAAAETL